MGSISRSVWSFIHKNIDFKVLEQADGRRFIQVECDKFFSMSNAKFKRLFLEGNEHEEDTNQSD
jgi:hypothetical protein